MTTADFESRPPEKCRRPPPPAVARLDSNGDGQLSKAEAGQQEKLIGLVESLSKADQDNNDQLSQEKFSMFIEEAASGQKE